MQCIVKKIDMPLREDMENGWKPYNQFSCSTKSVNRITNHISVLSPGKCPHPPHKHKDEEILIMISGEADVILGDNQERTRLKEGRFAYYPSFYKHTIENTSDQPATYMMFKWFNNKKTRSREKLQKSIFPAFPLQETSENNIIFKKIFEGPTDFLEKLECHTTFLKPGGGYKPHRDRHDVAIVLLEGEVETLGKAVKPLSIIYYPAGELHGMKNSSDCDASYLVFEFHGRATRPDAIKFSRMIMKRIKNKISDLVC